ncbi:hypothetical protein ABGB19_25120 [Mycobacterium sp. B14F4]|uniref:hypothetical protein n=1 Tax=Mycobacterium sp. B14F4 TaxID=3153565 RepID=UPI00325D1D5E
MHDVTGRLVRPKSPCELVTAINQLMRNDSRRQSPQRPQPGPTAIGGGILVVVTLPADIGLT